jgi:hypothetical protein
MSSKNLNWALNGLIICMVLLLLGGAYGLNKILTTKSQELTSLKAKSAALDQEQVSLAKAKQDIKTYADLEQIAESVVPQDKDQAQAVREIVNIAGDNGISLTSISFPASTLGTTKTGASASSGSTTPKPNANAKSSALSQLQPVKNIPGVYSLVITVQSDSDNPVAYSKFINFLNALEHNRRTAQVATISITPDPDNRNLLSFTLTLNEYIKP